MNLRSFGCCGESGGFLVADVNPVNPALFAPTGLTDCIDDGVE